MLPSGPGALALSLAPGTIVGRYVVRRKLAEGGMAEIFLAQSRGPEGFEKQVVVKRIRPALAEDPSFVQMFIAEARVASRLNHANIVHIFDFDRHEDTYWLAMEYVRGRSLAEVHRRARALERPLPPVLVAHVGAEVARGLAYAHRLTEHGQPLGLVHRDVTPHNVLVSFDGAVKLTDFGIAKASNRASTAGQLKGKFAYMSPEQARGEPVDARTDVFALAIGLWELLTGARLFDGDSDIAVLRAVQDREIRSPVELNPAVDPRLADVVMRALRRDPAERTQTAAELERGLVGWVIAATRAPEDTDIGAFVRALFPDEAAREDDEGPLPLQLVTPVAASGSAARASSLPVPGASAPSASRRSVAAAPAPGLHETVRSGSAAPPLEDEAFAPTRAPSEKTPRRESATRPGASVVTAVPASDELEALEAMLRRSPWTWPRRVALVALAVGAAAGLLRWRDRAAVTSTQAAADARVSPATTASAVPVPDPAAAPGAPRAEGAGAAGRPGEPATRPGAPTTKDPASATAAPASGTAPAATGWLVVRVQPWARLTIDGRPRGVIEESSGPIALPAGPHVVHLSNGKRPFQRTVQIAAGETQRVTHSFLDEE